MKSILIIFTLISIISCIKTNKEHYGESLLRSKTFSENNSIHKLTEYDRVWLSFRKKIINSEYEQIKTQTHFPLKVKGVTDSCPEKFIKQDDFIDFFKSLLIESTIIINGNSISIIEEIKMQKGKQYILIDSSRLRISIFVFVKENNNWMLDLIYNDDNDSL